MYKQLKGRKKMKTIWQPKDTSMIDEGQKLTDQQIDELNMSI